MNLRQPATPSDLSVVAPVPAVAVRVALAVLVTLLSLVVYGPGSGWFVVGIMLGLFAAWQPDFLLGWLVIVFLGLGELGRQATLSWQLLVLIAGVHLIHVLSMLTLGLPWRSRVQLAAFSRPLRRFVAIQIPSQLLAVAALLLFAPNAHGQRPLTVVEFTVIGGAALAALSLLLLRVRQDHSPS